ncbi:hypothetical protein [Chitinophaga japonensis]|uniref:Uncharacterized protein n=1 Tax=Chitinophaga japonensis TaxID=104662 RepID=A0A562T4B5_CHIJA|nr:hypothetical protein [Chitinophaga japonensis]TWI88213.1 hypothetical protein LX66_2296 [Chitinophaga japonensis]
MHRLIDHISYWRMLAAGIVALAPVMVSCEKEDAMSAPAPANIQTVPYQDTLRGVITENTLLINNRTWYIDGLVYVSNEATLTIEQGTVIKVVTGKRETIQPRLNGGLVITRGAKIMARGTPVRPIHFTVTDSSDNSHNAWCGMMLLGRAPVKKTPARQGTLILPSGNGLAYGGDIPEDSSGVLEYIRFDYLQIPPNKIKKTQQRSLQPGLLLLGTGSHTIVKDVVMRPVSHEHHLKQEEHLP